MRWLVPVERRYIGTTSSYLQAYQVTNIWVHLRSTYIPLIWTSQQQNVLERGIIWFHPWEAAFNKLKYV